MVDLEQPLVDIDTRGVDALHVTAFVGSVPIGRVVVPTTTETCTVDRLRAYLRRFDYPAFESALRRRFDDHPATVPTATVVICTRDRADRLGACLESLLVQTASLHEIIVVHNSRDDDGTRAVAATFGVRYVNEPDLGLDRARNRGAVEASTDVVLYTDDDVRADPAWAHWLLRPFADPQVMAATGLILPGELATDGQIEFEEMAGFVRTFDPFVMDGTVTPPAAAGRAGAGASMAFRRSFLLGVLGFPESLDAGQPTKTGGDTYALYQVLRKGYRVAFEPRAVAFHIHRSTPEDSRRAVHGYATGVIAYLLEAAIEDRSPAAAIAAVRWARSRVAAYGRSLIVHPGARSTRYIRTQVTGVVRAPRALRHARAATHLVRGVIDDESAAAATAPLAAAPCDWSARPASISVVIPTHGRRRSLVELVASLKALPYRGEVEIIVATDGPFADETALFAMLGASLECRVVTGSQGGAGAARNAGAAAARGDVVLFVDDDVLPASPHLLEAHNAAHAAGPAALVVGPIVPVHHDEGTLTLAARNWWADQAARLGSGATLDFTDVCSGNLSIRREAFAELEGFRPLPRQEDYDLGLRAVDAGLGIRAAPEGGVLHDADTTAADARVRRRQEGRADVEIVATHPLAAIGLRLGSWDHLGGWHRRAAQLGLRAPRLADGVSGALGRTIAPLDRLGSRWYLSRIHQLTVTLSYWAGVGDAVGGRDPWFALRGAIHAATRVAPLHPLDLGDLGTWRPPALGTTGAVIVSHEGVALGEADLRWGGIPFDRRRFGEAVIRHYAYGAITVEAERAVAR